MSPPPSVSRYQARLEQTRLVFHDVRKAVHLRALPWNVEVDQVAPQRNCRFQNGLRSDKGRGDGALLIRRSQSVDLALAYFAPEGIDRPLSAIAEGHRVVVGQDAESFSSSSPLQAADDRGIAGVGLDDVHLHSHAAQSLSQELRHFFVVGQHSVVIVAADADELLGQLYEPVFPDPLLDGGRQVGRERAKRQYTNEPYR
jgi:hypothetical protein